MRLLLNIPAERIAVAGVGDFEGKVLGQESTESEAGYSRETNATTRVVDLVITDVQLAMPSSPRDTEQISTFRKRLYTEIPLLIFADLVEKSLSNASRLTAGTNLSLTEPISIKQEPIEPIPGWTLTPRCMPTWFTASATCGVWDPDCDLDQPQYRGCPTALPFSFSGRSVFPPTVAFVLCQCVVRHLVWCCGKAVRRLPFEWPCARDLGVVGGESLHFDWAPYPVSEASQSNKFCPAESGSLRTAEQKVAGAPLALPNNDGVVLSANRTQTAPPTLRPTQSEM